MPSRYRVAKKRRAYRKRNPFAKRRRFVARRPMRSLRSDVHWFKRSQNFTAENAVVNNYTQAVSAGAGFTNTGATSLIQMPAGVLAPGFVSVGYGFSVGNLTAISEFANLFDSYRINKVVVKFIPVPSVVTGGGNYPATCPNIHWMIDHDDHNPFAASEVGLNLMKECSSYKWRKLLRPLSIVIKPRTSGWLEDTAGTAQIAIQAPRRAWLDMAQHAIIHNGLKFIIEGLGSDPVNQANYAVRIQTTYYMAFKGVR